MCCLIFLWQFVFGSERCFSVSHLCCEAVMCLVPEVCELMGMNLTGALIVVPPVPTNWEVNIATPPSAFIHRAPVPHALQSNSFQVILHWGADLQEVTTTTLTLYHWDYLYIFLNVFIRIRFYFYIFCFDFSWSLK